MFMNQEKKENQRVESEGRRDFLKTAGKFTAVTTPVVTALLSTTTDAQALVVSGTRHKKGRIKDRWRRRRFAWRWLRRFSR